MAKQILKGSTRHIRLFSIYESPTFKFKSQKLQLRYNHFDYGFSIHPSKRTPIT